MGVPRYLFLDTAQSRALLTSSPSSLTQRGMGVPQYLFWTQPSLGHCTHLFPIVTDPEGYGCSPVPIFGHSPVSGIVLTSSPSSLTQRSMGVPQYLFLDTAQSRALYSPLPHRHCPRGVWVFPSTYFWTPPSPGHCTHLFPIITDPEGYGCSPVPVSGHRPVPGIGQPVGKPLLLHKVWNPDKGRRKLER